MSKILIYWRRVGNELPATNQVHPNADGIPVKTSASVVIVTQEGDLQISFLVEGEGWVNTSENTLWAEGAVTHWMPLSPLSNDGVCEMTGADLIVDERIRQIAQEGYSPDHDARHRNGELSIAATAYARAGFMKSFRFDERALRLALEQGWPFGLEHLKTQGDAIDFYTKAGALIAAEIDRLIALQQSKEDADV